MSNWKKSLQKTRYIMDILLLVSFMIVSAPQATGVPLHEWFSLVFIVPFVIHILLHWDWFIKSFKRLFTKLPSRERFNIIWNYLLYFMMLLGFVSGFLVSVALIPAFNIDLQIQDFWSKIHHDACTLLFPMLGVHLALHWNFVTKLTKQMMSKGA